MIGEWNSEDDIAKARPKMIEFLDSLRYTLEELSSDLGVTDPHSGTVVIEKQERGNNGKILYTWMLHS